MYSCVTCQRLYSLSVSDYLVPMLLEYHDRESKERIVQRAQQTAARRQLNEAIAQIKKLQKDNAGVSLK